MSSITVLGFAFDEENEAKCAAHGITPGQVFAVLRSSFVSVRNRKQRRASHLLIGRDVAGRCLAIPVEATPDPVIWRPVTAWYCKSGEEALLQ